MSNVLWQALGLRLGNTALCCGSEPEMIHSTRKRKLNKLPSSSFNPTNTVDECEVICLTDLEDITVSLSSFSSWTLPVVCLMCSVDFNNWHTVLQQNNQRSVHLFRCYSPHDRGVSCPSQDKHRDRSCVSVCLRAVWPVDSTRVKKSTEPCTRRTCKLRPHLYDIFSWRLKTLCCFLVVCLDVDGTATEHAHHDCSKHVDGY